MLLRELPLPSLPNAVLVRGPVSVARLPSKFRCAHVEDALARTVVLSPFHPSSLPRKNYSWEIKLHQPRAGGRGDFRRDSRLERPTRLSNPLSRRLQKRGRPVNPALMNMGRSS
jgi:hypothetical protein